MGGGDQTPYDAKLPEYFSYFGSFYYMEHILEGLCNDYLAG